MDVDNISLGKIPPPSKALWCGLLGYDHDEVGNQYCCSFPFDKAIDPFGDVVLAYEMNGQPIPRLNASKFDSLKLYSEMSGPMGFLSVQLCLVMPGQDFVNFWRRLASLMWPAR